MMRIKICRKECKESNYWLKLVETKDDNCEAERQKLANEAIELMKIFNAILEKKK